MTIPDDPRPKPLLPPVDFASLNLRDAEADRAFLAKLKEQGVPISNLAMPSGVAATASHGPTPHQALSKVVYDMAKLIEQRMLGKHDEQHMLAERNTPEATIAHAYVAAELDFLERIVAMIVKAPLSSEYATRLAFEK